MTNPAAHQTPLIDMFSRGLLKSIIKFYSYAHEDTVESRYNGLVGNLKICTLYRKFVLTEYFSKTGHVT